MRSDCWGVTSPRLQAGIVDILSAMRKMWLEFLVSWITLPFPARPPKVGKDDRYCHDARASRVENSSVRLRNGDPAHGGYPYGLREEVHAIAPVGNLLGSTVTRLRVLCHGFVDDVKDFTSVPAESS